MTAAQQPASVATPTRGQIVHVLKLIIAVIPAIIAATVPGLSNDVNIILTAISGLLGTGEVVAHGIGGGR